MAAARGIRDTSRAGRYHNRNFLQIAEELGMTRPSPSPDAQGFSRVIMRDDTLSAYATSINRLSSTLRRLRERPDARTEVFDGPGSRRYADGGVRVKLACTCPRALYVVPSIWEKAPIICGACGNGFKPSPPSGKGADSCRANRAPTPGPKVDAGPV